MNPIGTFHVAIAAIIQKGEDILITRRSQQRDHAPGEWEAGITGRIDQHESPESAVHREVREETGLEVEIITPFDTFHFYRGAEKAEHIGINFWTKYVSGEVILNLQEQDEYKWLPPEEAISYLTNPNVIKQVRHFIDFKKRYSLEEHFDIVDEHNNPLGFTKPRSHVHADLKDWHRATGIYIFNEAGQILCQQRSMHKDVDPGIWQNHFGGHVKAGEDYIQNAVAELKEELGLTVTQDQLHFLGVYKSLPHYHHSALFVLHWNGRLEDLHFNDGEVEKVAWMDLEAYLDMQRQLHPDKEWKLNPLVEEYLKGK